MTSEVLGINSAFNSPKELRFADHLLENNILDDVEPLYENRDIINKLFNSNNKFSKSLMRIKEETLNPVKEENIYENVGFIEQTFNAINEKKQIKFNIKTEEKIDIKQEESIKNAINASKNEEAKNQQNLGNRFTSTLSLTIGKPLIVEANNVEKSELSIENGKASETVEEESDDGSFKSSYAKSLLDSFRKHCSSQSSISSDNLPRQSTPIFSVPEDNKPSVTFMYPIENEIIVQNTPKINVPKTNNCYNNNNKSVDELEKRVSSLTDNVLLKDKELEKLRQEIMFLKLECNRIKAENRSLKAGFSNGIIHRSTLSNGESLPHSPVSSTSADSDVWTLQQQVLSLNAQLEKAEISRHAYEAATRQLVHFLQTINSTLTTVAGPDAKIESPFTAQNTSELLNSLELSLLQTKSRPAVPPKIKTNPYFESSRDGSYLLSKSDLRSPSDIEKKYKSNKEVRNLFSRERNLMDASRGPESLTSNSSQDSLHLNRFHEAKDDSEKGSNSSKEVKLVEEPIERRPYKRSSPQRRFSISNKIWNTTKRTTPLIRSGSVNNLPTEASPAPRVSRAVSTHCVATDKIKPVRSESFDVSTSTNTASNKILSSKAKDFFSSLKNIFKAEDRVPSLEATSSSCSKKKMTLPSIHRSAAKVKSDFPPLSLPASAISQTNLKKKHSVKTLSMPRVLSYDEVDKYNSVFYVPSVAAKESEVSSSPLGVTSPSLDDSRSRSSISEASGVDPMEALSSGPCELSLALSLDSREDDEVSKEVEESSEPDKEDSPSAQENSKFISFMDPIVERVFPERSSLELSAPFHCIVTGDGNSGTRALRGSESSTYGAINGGGYFRSERYLGSPPTNLEFGNTKVAEISKNFSSEVETEKTRTTYQSPNSEELQRRRLSGGASLGVRRHRSEYDPLGIKVALWKMSRESYRAKECRLAFV